MALTIRDAQHLSWKTYKKMESVNKEQTNIESAATELATMTSRIALKIKTGRKPSDEPENRDEFANLFSSALFNILILAENQGVNLEESFLEAVDSYILGLVE